VFTTIRRGKNVMILKMQKFLFVIVFILSSSKLYSQCERKLLKVTLYKIPLYKEYWMSQSTTDIINNVNRHTDDSTTYKRTIQGISRLQKLDSTMRISKCMNSVICKSDCKCKVKSYSMDIRHVFELYFSDSSIIYLSLSSVSDLMKIDEKTFKKDNNLIKSLYEVF